MFSDSKILQYCVTGFRRTFEFITVTKLWLMAQMTASSQLILLKIKHWKTLLKRHQLVTSPTSFSHLILLTTLPQVYLSVCLFICVSVFLSLYVSLCMSVCVYLCVAVDMFVFVTISGSV